MRDGEKTSGCRSDRDIKVSPTSGTRGTEVTISGKGFTDGTADIMNRRRLHDQCRC